MTEYGLVLPTRATVMESSDGSDLTTKTTADIVELSKIAENIGFDSIWVGDSVLAKPRHEPLSTLAAIAAITERATLGTAVYVSPLRNPIHVAHQAITIDLISQGRLCLGVGTGTAGSLGSSVTNEFSELDVPWDKRGEILDEHLEVLTTLVKGESAQFDGEYYQLDNANLGLQPCGDIPIYVGSSADPKKGILKVIRERIAKYGDGWFPGVRSPESYTRGAEQLEQTFEKHDRDPDELNKLCYRDVIIDDNEEKALEREQEFLETYYPGFEPTRKEITGRCAFGSVNQVRKHLDKYADAGVEHFALRFTGRNQFEQIRKFSSILD